MKIKSKIKDCNIQVIIRCSLRETISSDAINVLKKRSCSGLMKLEYAKKRKAVFTGIKSVPLSKKLSEPISKYEFFFILEQFLSTMKNCRKAVIPYGDILFSPDMVYITPGTLELQLLYCPLKKEKFSSPMEFINNFLYSAVPVKTDDNNFISEFSFFFKGIKTFDIKKIEEYIAKAAPEVYIQKKDVTVKKSVPDISEQENTDNTGKKDISQNKRPHISGAACSPDEEETLLAEDNESTVLGNDEENETVLIDRAEPFLIRISTGETIKITKSFFRIGKKPEYVDYAVKNNNTVSRSHAEIIKKNNIYYIYDLESKNKTYINDRLIPSKTAFEINDNDKITLSDEEFIFHTKQ